MLKNFFKKNSTISLLIVLSLIIVINNFFKFFQNKTAHQYEPWLLNYQGGFVRRGLPGELFFQIHELLNLHLGWIVFFFVCFLYCLFYFTFFHLLKKIEFNKIFAFAILSPIAFYFPILNSKATGQKEIIFLCFLSIFCFLLPKMKRSYANYLMIFLTIIVGLSHDGSIFYLTYLVIPFIIFFKFENLKDLFLNLAPIIIVITVLTILIYFFSGSAQHTIDICSSIKPYSHPECETIGHISHLRFSIAGNIEQKISIVEDIFKISNARYFSIYGTGFIFGFLPLIILYSKSKLLVSTIGQKFHPLLILFFPLLITFPIYYLAADWGRYLYISYMSSLILIIFCLTNNIFYIKRKNLVDKDNMLVKILFIISIIIYGFGWTVPICCEKNFKPGISRAVKQVIYYYNKNN